ncbi:hypothetical protein FRC07_010684, partial [Ceratobasidium sp. 392]
MITTSAVYDNQGSAGYCSTWQQPPFDLFPGAPRPPSSVDPWPVDIRSDGVPAIETTRSDLELTNNELVLYLGAVIFEVLLNVGNQASVDLFVPWICRLNRFCVVSDHDSTLDDSVNRPTSGLKLTDLNYVMSNVPHSQTLHSGLPNRHPTASLAHTLNSPQFQLGRYIFMETVSGLMFGVPPLVEYDTSHPPIQNQDARLLERVHVCALAFVMAI